MKKIDGLELSLSFKDDNRGRLLPEECAYFNIKLLNTGSAAIEVFDLDANTDTPAYRVYDHAGTEITTVTHQTIIDRFSDGGMGESMPNPVVLINLVPGKSSETSLDLWNYMQPLAKGIYGLSVANRVSPGTAKWLESKQLRFEVIAAQVKDVVFGYEDIHRDSSLLLWVAVPEDGGQPQLLARLSTMGTHQVAQWSGSLLGPVDAGARVAVSGKFSEGNSNAISWFAVVDRGHVQLIQHFRTNPQWRSPNISLPISDARPVPLFPDRVDAAVFLATGSTSHGAVLAGVMVHPQVDPPQPWSVPLAAVPNYSACAFSKTGPIALLFATAGENGQNHLSRMDVESNGKVSMSERVIRSSSNRILAVAVDQRPQQPQSFTVLEADPASPEHLYVVRVPLTGEPSVFEIHSGLAQARSVDMQIGWNGAPVIALIDESGRCYAGALDGTQPAHISEIKNSTPVVGLHVAALRSGIGFGAFTDHGNFVFLGKI